MTQPTSIAGETFEAQTWRRIDELVDRVQAQVAGGGDERAFYATLLDSALRATAAVSGAVWNADAGQRWQPLVATDDAHAPWSAGQAGAGPHGPLLQRVAQSQQASAAPPDAANVSPYLLSACPVVVEGRVLRIVEICQRPDIPAEAARRHAEVLTALCELAADFHRRARLQELQARDLWWQRAAQFGEQLQQPLDLPRVAYAVVNETRRLLEVDRVTLAVRRRGRLRVQAVSGLDTFDPRATPVRQVERLAERVAAIAEPLVYTVGGPAVAPELETAVAGYIDQAPVRLLAAIPLVEPAADGEPPRAPHGVLLIESFTSTAGELDRTALDFICRHVRLAVARALRYEQIPAVRIWERLSRGRRPGRGMHGALWALPLAAVVAAMCLVPAEFRVTCRGQLRPQIARNLFAPRDGRIEQLHADHGDAVAAGQLLAELDSSELEYEWTRLAGELQTTQEQCQAVQAARLDAKPATAVERDEYVRQTAEEERLKSVLISLRQQQELLDQERRALQIRSPIAGHVLTWDLTDTLPQRPVKRGQLLMTVADTRGPWMLEVQVRDQDVGYVLAAQQAGGQPLAVRFFPATAPGRTYEGRLDTLAEIVEVDLHQQLSVTARVRVETAAIPHRLAGAGVVARIDCGQRPLGYVWLHDVIQAVRGWLFI